MYNKKTPLSSYLSAAHTADPQFAALCLKPLTKPPKGRANWRLGALFKNRLLAKWNNLDSLQGAEPIKTGAVQTRTLFCENAHVLHCFGRPSTRILKTQRLKMHFFENGSQGPSTWTKTFFFSSIFLGIVSRISASYDPLKMTENAVVHIPGL